MAAHKSQHFVPKVHLRPFSTDADRNAISLVNIKSGQAIHTAPIKHQCAKNYFYGKDGVLESLFVEIEGKYAEGVRKAESRNFDGGDETWLRLFMNLQFGRTEAAAEQIKQFYQKSAAITFRGRPLPETEVPQMDGKQLIIQALGSTKGLRASLEDLELRIFVNRTNTNFVTSDNPLMSTNRFYCQKIGEDTWGAISAGALFILPLTPRLAACLYDPGVYGVESSGYYVELKKQTDARAFNELQYLNAAENIYFSEPSDAERIATEFAAVSGRRVRELARLTEFLAKEMPDGRDRITPLRPGMDETKYDSKYIMYNVPRPIPARWPSVLPFRGKLIAHYNGSAAGYVRKSEWLKRFPK
jgi:hypothetical protein